MEIIIRILIPVLTSIVLGILLSTIFKSNRKELIENLTKEHIIIRMPKAYMWVGCIDILFFAMCMVLMGTFPNGTDSLWVWITFALFALLGVAIVWVVMIWKIEIFRSKDYFILRKATTKTQKMYYCECTSFKFGTSFLVLRTNEETVRIDSNATNLELLIAMLSKHKVKQIK